MPHYAVINYVDFNSLSDFKKIIGLELGLIMPDYVTISLFISGWISLKMKLY